MSAYRRTWPQRLADIAPYFGLIVIALVDPTSSSPASVLAAIVAVTLIVIGVERASHYRGQRDRYRRSLVALVRKVEMDQVPAYFSHLVPADVLAEAFPKPTPAPRSVSEGCSDNRREVGDDV